MGRLRLLKEGAGTVDAEKHYPLRSAHGHAFLSVLLNM
jgi:hypothetical protein